MSDKTNLSEQELLLLSNYEYFNCSTDAGTIGENINKLKNEDGTFDINKVLAQGACGDIISEDDAVDILTRLENSEKLSNFHMARCINKGGIRATLFADKGEEQATLVFRGTGGTYKAWEDNVLGEYQTDTKLQTLAADFVKYECGAFDDITVTGHSKGGNLSQYVTIVCGEQVSRCVSFDGQGFGKNFLEAHDDEVKVARDKITSISGFNDFVNILLTPVAGTVLYVKNQEGISVDMHSCYTMLSNGSFDSNGDFRRDFGVIPQLPAMTMAKWASDGIVSVMNSLPEDGEQKATEVLAAWVASIFSNDKGDEYEKKRISETIAEFKNYTNKLIGVTQSEETIVSCCREYLYICVEKVKEAYNAFDNIYDSIVAYPENIEDIQNRLDYSILGRSYTEKALNRIVLKTKENVERIGRIRDALREIIAYYEQADMA